MPLPEPSAEQRELLEAVWRSATAELRWPAADELEPSPDAETLGGLAPEFVRLIRVYEDIEVYEEDGPSGTAGWRTLSEFMPDRQELALTIAGVAACDREHPVLSAFLDFLKVGFAVWRREHLPDEIRNPRPGQLIPNHIREASKDYLPSFTALMERVGYPPRPPAMPDDGLDFPDLALYEWRKQQPVRAIQLLKLLITVETAGWAIIEGGSIEMLDQAYFQPFAGVSGLDDYWDRRLKPWTRPSLAEAMHQQTSARPDTYNRARLFKARPSLLDDLLLDSIYTAAKGQVKSFLLCPPPDYEIDPTAIMETLERLETWQLVLRPTLDPGPELPAVALTEDGARRVRTNRQTRDNIAIRSQQARDALLAWLYDQQDNPQYVVHIQRFLGDARSLMNGQFFSPTDVNGAASYLLEKQLIRTTAITQANALATARIASRGIDCVEDGGSVSDYLKKQPPVGGSGYTFNAPITATNFAAGDHAQQVASSHGMSGSEIRDLMQAIVEALPGLELQPAYAGEVTTIVGEVVSEADHVPRDHAKLQLALERLRTLLTTSGKTALAATLTALINATFIKLGLPPGAAG